MRSGRRWREPMSEEESLSLGVRQRLGTARLRPRTDLKRDGHIPASCADRVGQTSQFEEFVCREMAALWHA